MVQCALDHTGFARTLAASEAASAWHDGLHFQKGGCDSFNRQNATRNGHTTHLWSENKKHFVLSVAYAFENQTAFELFQKDISLLAVTPAAPQENVSKVSNLPMGTIPVRRHPQFQGGELCL